MKKKEQSELEKEWLLVVLAAMLGFLINITASAAYDLWTSKFDWIKLVIFVIAGVLSIFIGHFFTYIFQNMNKLKNEKNSFPGILWKYIKSIMDKTKKNEESVRKTND